MCEYSSDPGNEDCILVTEDRYVSNDVIHKLTMNGTLVLSLEIVLPGVKHCSALYMSNIINSEVLISMGNGWLIIFDTSQFSIKKTFRVNQNLRCFVRDDNNILFSTTRGTLVWYTKEGEQLQEIGKLPDDQMVHISWGKEKQKLWLVGFSYICLVYLSNLGPEYSVRSILSVKQVGVYMITCCGLNYNLQNGDQLVAGDLSGNVYIWDVKQSTPIMKGNVPISVRCIVWTKQIGILIGCLDGSLYRWDTQEEEWSTPKLFCTVANSSLLHLRLDCTNQYVAVGTSLGQLGVLALNKENVCYYV